VRPDSFAARAATYSNSVWHAELAERFVRWLGLPAGVTVVDIGTGTGFAALAVARTRAAVGQTGAARTRVLGVDRSPAMLSVARQRAEAAGRNGAVTFAAGDAHQLAVRDEGADAVMFVTSLHYMAVERALGEARRVARPGGTVAVGALPTESLVPSALFRKVLGEHGVEAPDRMAATGSPERLTARLAEAGLGDVQTSPDTLRLGDGDLGDAWAVNLTMAARRLADWTEAEVAALREQWEERVAAARAADEEGFRSVTMLMARAERPDR
jgi:SAM-dependent methyltransferase